MLFYERSRQTFNNYTKIAFFELTFFYIFFSFNMHKCNTSIYAIQNEQEETDLRSGISPVPAHW